MKLGTGLLKSALPAPAVNLGRRGRDWLKRRQVRSAEAVFTDIYARQLWGDGDYCSGWGSHAGEVVEQYVALVRGWLQHFDRDAVHLVDLGCGDFAVGSLLVDVCATYAGVDVVKPLVERNQTTFGSESVRFIHADITRDPLPDGNICILRQVLQHLSNQQIAAVLRQVEKYEWTLITENQPAPGNLAAPNVDRPAQSGTRVRLGSGVYLEEPPFSLAAGRISILDEMPAPQGVLRTYLLKGLAAPGSFPAAALVRRQSDGQ